MSNLVPGLIPLESGLNLQTAKIAAPPGSSLDMLNYEQVDFVGQKRIDGYVRYDGNMQPVLDEYLVLTLTSMLPGSPGDLLYVNGEFWGRLLEADGFTIYVAVYNHKLTPNVGDNITWDGDVLEVEAVNKGKDVEGITAEEHYNNLLRYMNVLRGEIGDLPPVAGLHWHEDRLYAVADVLAVIVNTEEEGSLCIEPFFMDGPFGSPNANQLDPLPEWYGVYSGQGIVFSNYPSYEDRFKEDFWYIEVYMNYYEEYDHSSEWYRNGMSGDIPWGHHDDPPNVVDAYAMLLSDGYWEEEAHCARVGLSARVPQ